MYNLKISIAVVLICFLLMSCYTIKQDIGSGAPKVTVVHKHKWYALWGISPLNTVDAKKLAGTSTNYSIKTQFSFSDMLISLVTGCFSIVTETVTVTK